MTRLFWLSFVDPDRPAGERFLGACIVEVTTAEIEAAGALVRERFPNALPDADGIAAAARKAHAMGCNPGGEVGTLEIPVAAPPALLALERHRLFSRDELIAAGVAE